MTARAGSLASGAGMLDRAVESLFGVRTAWHAEVDPAASKVLAHRFPGAPNLGDFTATDWSSVETVELLCGGIPCTPWSAAGGRLGSEDDRDLWPVRILPDGTRPRRGAVDAIRELLPAVVVLENVDSLVNAERGQPFGTVLSDLDGLGYTVAWTTVGACRVGACHHRHRYFALAVRGGDVRVPSSEPVASRDGGVWRPVQDVLFGDLDAVRWPESGVVRDGLVWPLSVVTCGSQGVVLPTPQARDMDGRGSPSREVAAARWASGRRNLDDAVALMPTPTARDATRGAGWGDRPGAPLSEVAAVLPTGAVGLGRFGRFAPAVGQQERIFGGPAPDPTVAGRRGSQRLSPWFTEWMQMLPAGWVTDLIEDGRISREDAGRIIGNGVVGRAVEFALPSLPTWPAAVDQLSRVGAGVAA